MKDLILHFFQAKSFPELAAAVRARGPSVLARWEAAVKEILPTADELTQSQLRNSLPDTLENLAKALESNQANPTRTLMNESQEHGAVRFIQSYNLTELLIEFDVLRPILMEETALFMKRDVSLGEIIALNMGIDLASRRSVLAFVNYQKQELVAAANAHAKYLSFMSHDVRGGLNAILLSTDVLHQELADHPQFAEALSDVETIKRNIHETVSTMDRFLRAEQLRSGKVTPRLTSVDLLKLAGELATQFRQQAMARGSWIKVESTADATVETDAELAFTILQNLVGNAVKYDGGGEITIAIRAGGPGGGGTTVAVTDHGPGIPPERLEQLFSPFVRGETQGQSGVGLGLYIARQAAEIIGATLRADSKLGEGTTFVLQFPAASTTASASSDS
jgi:signal transduction histidine kinase